MNESLYPTEKIRQRIIQLSKQYKWFTIADDGIVEIFCDHHMLNTLRTCEQKFVDEILNGIKRKGGVWALDFGSFFHKCMEWFDEAEQKGFIGKWNEHFSLTPEHMQYLNFNPNELISTEIAEKGILNPNNVIFRKITHLSWIARCGGYWYDNNLDQYKEESGFKTVKGWQGAMSLLLQYWNQYGNNKERLRTVGTELCFGRGKEVPIQLDPSVYTWQPFRCYLTGRIDRVVDNGRMIGPLDRKTQRMFSGKEVQRYKPNDAFCGYIIAIQNVLKNRFELEHRQCNGLIVDLVSLTEPTIKTKNKERFKRLTREWKLSEIEEFYRRQQATFAAIWQILVEGRFPQWSTSACANMYYRQCPYILLHEAAPEMRSAVLQGFYELRKLWDPYETDKDVLREKDDEDQS